MWGSDAGNKFGGGGGFVAGGVTSPRKTGGFGAGGGDDKTKGPRRSQNIVPVAIRQLVECTEESLKIEEMEVHVVTIVGLIRAIEETTTKITYIIDDQTATIEAINYVGTDGDGTPDLQTVLTEGSYGRIVGQLRAQKGERGSKYIIIFKVFPVTDMNEMTCHCLEVLQVPIRLRKLREQESFKTGVGMTDMGNTLTTSMMGSSFSETASTGNAGVGGARVNGLSRDQNAVFQVLKGCRDEKGLHRDQIIQNLKNKVGPKEIASAIEFLSGEGHIFSTVDDDHYKCTDW